MLTPAIQFLIGGLSQSGDFLTSGFTILSKRLADSAKGEGEGVILDAVNDRNLTGIIQGMQVEDLNRIPFPDFSILSDQDRLPRITPISTSRGCPYDCVFCTVSSTFGRKHSFLLRL